MTFTFTKVMCYSIWVLGSFYNTACYNEFMFKVVPRLFEISEPWINLSYSTNRAKLPMRNNLSFSYPLKTHWRSHQCQCYMFCNGRQFKLHNEPKWLFLFLPSLQSLYKETLQTNMSNRKCAPLYTLVLILISRCWTVALFNQRCEFIFP